MSAVTSPMSWDAALGDYRAKRAHSDTLSIEDDRADEALDAYCVAMDHLVEEVASPDWAAVVIKLELARERWEDQPLPPEWLDAFIADVQRLGKDAQRLRRGVDPHRGWLTERDAAMWSVNCDPSLNDEQSDFLNGELNRIENRIVETTAQTLDGVAIQLLVISQLPCQGHEPSEDQTWPVVERAAELLGCRPLSDLGFRAPASQRAHEEACFAANEAKAREAAHG